MKIINEDFEYSKEDILQYVKNLENACSELRSCLYALSNSLEEEYPELNTMVKGSIVNFDDFHEYILSDLNDIKDGLNPQEDEEDYNESLNEEM